jgi:hypothetical protein
MLILWGLRPQTAAAGCHVTNPWVRFGLGGQYLGELVYPEFRRTFKTRALILATAQCAFCEPNPAHRLKTLSRLGGAESRDFGIGF